MEEKNLAHRKGNVQRLFFFCFLLIAIIPYFLKDWLGSPFTLGGTFFWVAAFGISFLSITFYFSQFLLPLPWQLSWYEGFRLTIRYNFPLFVDFIRWFFIRPNNMGATPNAIVDLPPGFTRHKAGIIRSHKAPVIFKGSNFIRGAEPGFLRLEKGEIVVQVIDLRRQLRVLPMRVLTRDGIALETDVSALFQVRQMEESPVDYWQFPFDQDAIFMINYLGNFRSEDDLVIHWTDRVPRQAASALIGEVSRYSLYELLEIDESDVSPLEKIRKRVTDRTRRAFDKYGIEVLSISVSPFKVPEDLKEQRLANWKAGWERRIKVEQKTANEEIKRRLKIAKTRSQRSKSDNNDWMVD